MTDRELLERAAKAAGIRGEWEEHQVINGKDTSGFYIEGEAFLWNPLEDDGDALRLAVKLRICLLVKTFPHAVFVEAYNGTAPSSMETLADVRIATIDPAAATRRAIVRAAAAMLKDT